jgi:hypothetical protein
MYTKLPNIVTPMRTKLLSIVMWRYAKLLNIVKPMYTRY